MNILQMKIFLSAMLGALCAAGAQAQTTTIVNTTLVVPTSIQESTSFTVTGPSTLFIEGAAISDSDVQGIGFLVENNNVINVFSLTNGSVNTPVFNTFTLSDPGSYSFLYDFANADGTVGNTVTVDATVTPLNVAAPETVAAPEIDSASTLAALTMLVGGILVVRGRRTEAMSA